MSKYYKFDYTIKDYVEVMTKSGRRYIYAPTTDSVEETIGLFLNMCKGLQIKW